MAGSKRSAIKCQPGLRSWRIQRAHPLSYTNLGAPADLLVVSCVASAAMPLTPSQWREKHQPPAIAGSSAAGSKRQRIGHSDAAHRLVSGAILETKAHNRDVEEQEMWSRRDAQRKAASMSPPAPEREDGRPRGSKRKANLLLFNATMGVNAGSKEERLANKRKHAELAVKARQLAKAEEDRRAATKVAGDEEAGNERLSDLTGDGDDVSKKKKKRKKKKRIKENDGKSLKMRCWSSSSSDASDNDERGVRQPRPQSVFGAAMGSLARDDFLVRPRTRKR